MNVREATTQLPQLTRAATFRPKSVNEEARTVELVWTTGARVMRGYYDRFWEELSLDPKHVRMRRLNNGAPFLNSHNTYDVADVIGVVESARLDGDKGIAIVRFAKAEDDPEADKIFRKIKDGILQNISVGYRVYKMEKTEDGADKIPVYRAVDWEPYEISTVPIGADDGAGTRAADSDRYPCVFVTRQEKKPMADEEKPTVTVTVAQPAPVDPAVAATRAATTAKIEDAKALAAKLTAERELAVA